MIEFAEILVVFPGFPQRPFFTRGCTIESEGCMMIERAIPRVLQEQRKKKYLSSPNPSRNLSRNPSLSPSPSLSPNQYPNRNPRRKHLSLN